MTRQVGILGGGPAGSAAALAALKEGAAVEIVEKSRFPRHKVCGEFLSAQVAEVLERLGVLSRFLEAGPARMSWMALHIGRVTKRARLPDAAYGLSRFTLDHRLLTAACERGAVLVRAPGRIRGVIATGRRFSAPRGRRHFGFKAHFDGPQTDGVELYFFNGCYVGVSPVEAGGTNVCGLAPEELLMHFNFDPESIIKADVALRERMDPLHRRSDWLITGPLIYGNRLRDRGSDYRCGDALSFVDPFTGSGVLNALVTGRLAGIAASAGDSTESHLARCRKALQRPLWMAALFRKVLEAGWAEKLAPPIPAQWLYWLTRPTLL